MILLLSGASRLSGLPSRNTCWPATCQGTGAHKTTPTIKSWYSLVVYGGRWMPAADLWRQRWMLALAVSVGAGLQGPVKDGVLPRRPLRGAASRHGQGHLQTDVL